MKQCFLGEDTCGTIVGEAILDSVRFNGTLKTCTEYSACKAGIQSITFGPGMKLQRNALCCQKESWQEELEKSFPVNNATRNGFQCPACYMQESDSCEVQKTVDCVGSEDHCIYFTCVLNSLENGATTGTTFVARGCATQSVCNHSLGLAVFSGDVTYTLSTIKECQPAHDARNSACLHDHSWRYLLFLHTTCFLMSSFGFLMCLLLNLHPL
nr:phospholipase A2 inhibitor and Ly6/PLAUR domain-containing protein-like [Pogona vitticeps]